MEEASGLTLIAGLVSQLSDPSGDKGKGISTTTLDSIFYELEVELDKKIRDGELLGSDLRDQSAQCRSLLEHTGSALKDLNAVSFLSDTQFYWFLRLKKIHSNLLAFQKRYDQVTLSAQE